MVLQVQGREDHLLRQGEAKINKVGEIWQGSLKLEMATCTGGAWP